MHVHRVALQLSCSSKAISTTEICASSAKNSTSLPCKEFQHWHLRLNYYSLH